MKSSKSSCGSVKSDSHSVRFQAAPAVRNQKCLPMVVKAGHLAEIVADTVAMPWSDVATSRSKEVRPFKR